MVSCCLWNSCFGRIVVGLGLYFVDKIIFDELVDLDFDNVVEVDLDSFGDDESLVVMRNYFFFVGRNLVVVDHAIYARIHPYFYYFDFDDDDAVGGLDCTGSYVDFV